MVQVLMVDDNPDDIELTVEAFKETDKVYNVNVAQDGIEALKYLRKEDEFSARPDPDLILLDLNMPKMNGFEVLEELKKDGTLNRIPVIVFSMSQNESDIKRVGELNAKAYIVKPVGFEGISDVVKRIEAILET